jgi:hypothetical protein
MGKAAKPVDLGCQESEGFYSFLPKKLPKRDSIAPLSGGPSVGREKHARIQTAIINNPVNKMCFDGILSLSVHLNN